MFPYDNGKLFITGTEHYEFAQKHAVGSVLDVGCGYGGLIPYLDCEYTGIDATKDAIDRATDKRVKFCFVENYYKKHATVVALGLLETNELIIIDKLISLAKIKTIVSYTKGNLRTEFKRHDINDIAKYFDEVVDGEHQTFFIKWAKNV